MSPPCIAMRHEKYNTFHPLHQPIHPLIRCTGNRRWIERKVESGHVCAMPSAEVLPSSLLPPFPLHLSFPGPEQPFSSSIKPFASFLPSFLPSIIPSIHPSVYASIPSPLVSTSSFVSFQMHCLLRSADPSLLNSSSTYLSFFPATCKEKCIETFILVQSCGFSVSVNDE